MVSSFGTSFLFTPSKRDVSEYSFCIRYGFEVITLTERSKKHFIASIGQYNIMFIYYFS